MLCNVTQKKILVERPYLAVKWRDRARGMIGRDFDQIGAMIFPHCSSIHTWFMKKPIDIIFLDRQKRILSFEIFVKPWRMISGPTGTKNVIELPGGRLSGVSLFCNDMLAWP